MKEDITDSIIICEKCILYKTTRHKIIGGGELTADILVLGSSPSISSDAMGRPFAGNDGRLIRSIIEEAAVLVECENFPSIFYTNMVFCYAPHGVKSEYILACRGNLLHVLDVVCPKIIIFCGKQVEKSYKKEYPHGVTIPTLEYLEQQGGRLAPEFNLCIRNVGEALKCL